MFEKRLCVPCNVKLPLYAVFVLPSASSFNSSQNPLSACSWVCVQGFALSGNGSCYKLPTTVSCKPMEYKDSKTGSCFPCDAGKCSPWQYVSCTNAQDSVCRNCSQCPIGKYLVGCTLGYDSNCSLCTNKYEVSQCGGNNFSTSLYTGPGLIQSNCPWRCIDSYYNAGGSCKQCSASPCPTGMYRAACTESSDATCTPCSGLPEHAFFTSAGVPYNLDNCTWQCTSLFYLQRIGNVSKCSACQQPSTCPIGQYVGDCKGTQNYACTPCLPVSNAMFTTQGNCNFECVSGFFQGRGGCLPCTTGIVCSSGQIRLSCTSTHDAVCTQCKPGIEYQITAPNGTASCFPCTNSACDAVGQYRALCPATSDASCASCSNGPLYSYYLSSGANGANNCSWQCNAGFESERLNGTSSFVCSPCKAGSYSRQGDTACTMCSAGTFSAQYGVTSPDLCTRCQTGYYSTTTGATSAGTCVLCSVGLYQESQGSSFCASCPINTYGTAAGATSLSTCLACRTLDTSTRGAVGQQFETSCVCNPSYYRIDNRSTDCQTCPPGLSCNGYKAVLPAVNGSVWNITTLGTTQYYRLVYCPSGYFYSGLNQNLVSDPNAQLVLASQQCTACDAGLECVQPPCVNCSLCLPGYYKSCPGSANCGKCDPNTYAPNPGSVSCQLCGQGTTTNGQRGCVSSHQCVCDSKNYDLALTPSQGCQVCPAGLDCFGNSTVQPKALAAGASGWNIVVDTDGKSRYNLTFCPFGYYLVGNIGTPGQMQCVPCASGFECTDPPCYGSCSLCKPGFYKAANITYPAQVSRSSFDPISQKFTRVWIEEPCLSCPVNTYRKLEGGTEVGSCTTCPAKSTTRGLLNRTSPTDCKCDIFYYQQAISADAGLTCADCPEGAVCASDRSCALGNYDSESFRIGDTRSDLVCLDPKDNVYGTWQRNLSGEYRLIACPAGFTMQRSDLSLTSDKCIECPVGSYSLVEVTSTTVQCKPCPIGATCPGGSVVQAVAGFWREAKGRRAVDSTAAATIYQCPLGVCGSGNSCNNNRTGMVICFFISRVCLFLM